MTITLFLTILTIGAAVSGLLTQAIKKFAENAKIQYSSNVIALLNAIAVGGAGTAFAYALLAIPFTASNLVCWALMIVCIWIGSMVGYDKVIQLIKQITNGNNGI